MCNEKNLIEFFSDRREFFLLSIIIVQISLYVLPAMVDCHFQLVKSGTNGQVYDFQLSINLKGIFLKRMALLKCQKLGHD